MGLRNQDPNADDLVASYSFHVGRVFRESLIGGASRGGRSGIVNKNGKLCREEQYAPDARGGREWGTGPEAMWGPRLMEPLSDALDRTGL